MTVNSSGRKLFVVDTSVLLYDKESIHSFPGNDVVIPLIVLEELDRFKDREGIIGENARYVNRYLDKLRAQGSLHDGIMIDDDQMLTVRSDSLDPSDYGLDENSADNRIITLAIHLNSIEESRDQVIMVTKDINFRVKCDALGLPAEDYYKDSVPKGVKLFSGQSDVLMPGELVDKIYSKKGMTDQDVIKASELLPNEMGVIIASDKQNQRCLAIRKERGLISLSSASNSSIHITPRNKEQRFAIHLLEDEDIPLVTLTGIAGSGKTFLTLMAGLNGLWEGRYKRIVISRPIVPVGRDLGFLPGDVNEKMAPWLTPILDNFREGTNGTKDNMYFDLMKDKGQIEVAPLSFIRGRTFNDSFMIVDEAQNATIHELKTVITRVGRGSKLVLLGDTDQVDTPYIDSRSNGLSIVVERFKEEWLAGHIRLPKGERSELATVASSIL